MGQTFLYLVLGFGAGAFSGLIGIGGGVILVPLLVFLFQLPQHQAQGTTLALLPIGVLAAAWTYYKQGFVDIQIASLICLGFFFGGLLGARYATGLSTVALERVFGVALLPIALKMILAK